MADTDQMLRDLIDRVAALELHNHTLTAENQRMRVELTRLSASNPAPLPETAIHTGLDAAARSRRAVLGTGLKLAAGALGAGALLAHQTEPARADANHTSTSFVSTNGQYAILAQVYTSENGDVPAIVAEAANSSNASISANSFGLAPGIDGYSFLGNGVVGKSQSGEASGVYGTNEAHGFGVAGDTTSVATSDIASIRAGVFGRNNDTGPGMFGMSVNDSGDGVHGHGKVGVHGTSSNGSGVLGESASGYGGVFKGAKAQVRLTPTPRIGKPTTGAHLVGELYLDKLGALFICTVAGTPGTWRKVSTVSA